MKITVRIEKNKLSKNNKAALFLDIFNLGKRYRIAVGYSVHVDCFDEIAQRVKKNISAHKEINALIETKINEVEKKILLARVTNQAPILKDNELRKNIDAEQKTFSQFVHQYIKNNSNKLSEKTKRGYLLIARNAEQFFKQILLKDITIQKIDEFENYLSGLGHAKNYTIKLVGRFKTVLNIAHAYGYIKNNPAKNHKTYLKKEEILKDFLEAEEIKKIENSLTFLTKQEHHVACWFLLSCYTGLRFSDIFNFNFNSSVKKNELIVKTEKTGSIVSIGINEKITECLERVKKFSQICSSQKTNVHLKTIAQKSAVSKKISFHTARHTFACMCAEVGVPIEVTQKWLGHSDTKTTLIYYKLKNKKMTEFAHLFNAL